MGTQLTVSAVDSPACRELFASITSPANSDTDVILRQNLWLYGRAAYTAERQLYQFVLRTPTVSSRPSIRTWSSRLLFSEEGPLLILVFLNEASHGPPLGAGQGAFWEWWGFPKGWKPVFYKLKFHHVVVFAFIVVGTLNVRFTPNTVLSARYRMILTLGTRHGFGLELDLICFTQT